MVWHSIARLKSVQNKLKKFQRDAMMLMGNLRPSTPGYGLMAINCLPPLEMELRRAAAEAHIRCHKSFQVVPLTYTNIQSHKGHRQHCEEFLRNFKFNLHEKSNDKAHRTYFFNDCFVVDKESMQPANMVIPYLRPIFA